MSAPAVEARELRHRFGAREALAGISFRIEPGSIVALLGPNGGGKTTLFRILATLLRPTSGEAFLMGRPVAGAAIDVRARLGVVFQRPALDGKLTVRENLRCRARIHGLSRAEAGAREGEAMESLGLSARARDRAETLSGGMQRRVELAMSLLHRPDVLLLDEPSTGLDPAARRDFFDLLQAERRRRGMTVLMTTHFIEEADRCDQVGLLSEGRLLAMDEPSRLKSALSGDVVVVQADPIEPIAAGLRARLGLSPVVGDRSLRFEAAEGFRMVGRIAESFPGQLRGISWGPPTLEDVFFRLAGRGLKEPEA